MDDEFFNWEDPCYGLPDPPTNDIKTDKRCINRVIQKEWIPGEYCINCDFSDELTRYWTNSLNLLGNENK